MTNKAHTHFMENTDGSLRAFRRHAVVLSALVHRENSRTTWTASVEDISLSGLFFVCQWAFPVRSVVRVHLRLGTIPISVPAIVRRQIVQQVAGKQCYGCGVQFVRTEKTAQALLHLINYLNKQVTSDETVQV